MADLIPRMSVCTRYGYELGFYDVKFAGIRPVEWRGLYFKVPDRISVALDTLVELSMTHNVIGVDATRGDISLRSQMTIRRISTMKWLGRFWIG